MTGRALRALRRGVAARWEGAPPPPFNHGASLGDMSPEEALWWEAELPRLMGLGVITQIPKSQARHVSRVFTTPKPTPGTFRLVVDLRHVNAFSPPGTAEVEGLNVLPELLEPKDFMCSLDLSDGYYHFRIRPADQVYFQFQVGDRYYQLAALNMGWSLSPGVFTDFLRYPVEALRAKGIKLLWYLDDFLIMAPTRDSCAAARDEAVALFRRLGLLIKEAKCVWEPTQRLTHLGMLIDAETGHFEVDPRKGAKVQRLARSLLARAHAGGRRVAKRDLAAFAGLCQFLVRAVPRARLHLRAIYDVLPEIEGWTGRVRLTRAARADLQWWCQLTSQPQLPRGPIWRPRTTAVMYTDASDYGWGGRIELGEETYHARGLWSPGESLTHITLKELTAITRTLQAHPQRLAGHRVRLFCDNQSVVGAVRNTSSRSQALMAALKDLFGILDKDNIDLQIEYIRSEDNSHADELSRVREHDFVLNRTIFELLPGNFTIDRFADDLNSRLTRFNSRWPCPGSERVDALSASDAQWRQEDNYCYPPWALLPALAVRLYESGASATVVAPDWRHTPWYQRLHSLATEVVCLPRTADLLSSVMPGRPTRPPRWPILAFRCPVRAPRTARGCGFLPIRQLVPSPRRSVTGFDRTSHRHPGRPPSGTRGDTSWATRPRPRYSSTPSAPASRPTRMGTTPRPSGSSPASVNNTGPTRSQPRQSRYVTTSAGSPSKARSPLSRTCTLVRSTRCTATWASSLPLGAR